MFNVTRAHCMAFMYVLYHVSVLEIPAAFNTTRVALVASRRSTTQTQMTTISTTSSKGDLSVSKQAFNTIHFSTFHEQCQNLHLVVKTKLRILMILFIWQNNPTFSK